MSQDRLKQTFRSALDLPADVDVEALEYGKHEHWDSLGHMALVAEIEDAFDLMIDTDDVIAMSSYPVVTTILRDNYAVAL